MASVTELQSKSTKQHWVLFLKHKVSCNKLSDINGNNTKELSFRMFSLYKFPCVLHHALGLY